MTIVEKLQFLKDETGLSQEALARRFEVSFATLNSWINGRSQPHAKMQEKIDEMYRRLTGDKVIPREAIKRLKDDIKLMQEKRPAVLKHIRSRDDLFKEFVLSLTYNSNRIEGSTLSDSETAAILFDNATIPNKDLIEHLEAKNHQAALNYLFDYLDRNQAINEDLILKLHSILMNGIRDDAGRYRTHGVRIVGANIPTANYLKVPELMAATGKEFEREDKDVVAQAAKTHSRFEQIHPFADGNGRIGRLLVHAQMLRANLPPVIINARERKLYYNYLNKCQRIGDSSLLEEFFCDGIMRAYKIIGED